MPKALPTIRPVLATIIDGDLGNMPSVGIDTIGVGGPLKGLPDFTRFQHTNLADYDLSGRQYITGAWTQMQDVRFGVRSTSSDGRPHGHWEASIPTLIRGQNLQPASLGEAIDSLNGQFDLASQFVDWDIDFGGLAISRLDTTRDFLGIGNIPHVLAALSRLPIPKSAQRHSWGTSAGLNGLVVQVPGRWRAQLYDKQIELMARRPKVSPALIDAAFGVLRFEVRTWRAVNRTKPYATTGGLSPMVVENHNRPYFDKCGFGQEVGGPNKIERVIAESVEASNCDEVARMLGLEIFLALSGTEPYAEMTNRKYRKMARAADLSPADLVAPTDSSIRLSHSEGTLSTARYGTPSDLTLRAVA